MIMDDVLTTTQAGPGGLLRQAREAKQLGLDEVAANLKLSRRQVQALEAGHFSELPGLTFVRGFVRNYARLLELDAVPLLAMIEGAPGTVMPQMSVSAQAEPKAPTLIKLPQRAGSDYLRPRRGFPVKVALIAALVALAVAGGAAWMLNAQTASEPLVTMEPATPALESPMPIPPAAVESVLPPIVQPAPMPPAALAGTTEQVPPVSAEPLQEAASKPNPVLAENLSGQSGVLRSGIQLAFTGDSWVEIIDADGGRVVAKLYRPGAEETIQGKAPFKLVIGNAAQVKLSYNGQPIDLAKHIKINVARLTLD